MPKTREDRQLKRQNKTGLVEMIGEPDLYEVAPKYRRARWGFAISELEGRCFSYASFGGGWPLTMGFRKHLYKANGVCRRCRAKRPASVEWDPCKDTFIIARPK